MSGQQDDRAKQRAILFNESDLIAAESEPSDWMELESIAAAAEAEALAKDEARFKDPAYCLEYLRKNVASCNKGLEPKDDSYAPLPTLIEKVFHVSFSHGGLTLIVRAQREDGGSDTLYWNEWSSPGTYEDPPDGGGDLYWLSDLDGHARKGAVDDIHCALDEEDEPAALAPRGQSVDNPSAT